MWVLPTCICQISPFLSIQSKQPATPRVGPNGCPAVWCTILLFAFKSLYELQIHCHGCTESLVSMAELFMCGCSSCRDLAAVPPVPTRCWGGLGAASWPLSKEKIWIWVETVFSCRACTRWSALPALKLEVHGCFQKCHVAQGGGESAAKKPTGDYRF